MMRISVVTAATLMAMMAWGCGSSSSSTGTPAANNDTTAGDTAAQQDTVAADAGAQTDAGMAADAGPVDSGPIDAGAPDTGPPPKTKCASTDNACLNACATKDCAAQVGACSTDINCGKILGCLNDCDKKPPVELPGEATHTCSQKCYFTYGEDATDKFIGQNLCVLSQCLAADYQLPCGANATCQNYCIMDLCDAEVLACLNEPACVGFFACVNSKCVDAATQQACAGECNNMLVEKYGMAAAQKASLAQGGIATCGQSKCM